MINKHHCGLTGSSNIHIFIAEYDQDASVTSEGVQNRDWDVLLIPLDAETETHEEVT